MITADAILLRLTKRPTIRLELRMKIFGWPFDYCIMVLPELLHVFQGIIITFVHILRQLSLRGLTNELFLLLLLLLLLCLSAIDGQAI